MAGQVEELILHVCHLTAELKQAKEGKRYPNRFRHLHETLLPALLNVGRHCPEWPACKKDSEIKLLVQENSNSNSRIS